MDFSNLTVRKLRHEDLESAYVAFGVSKEMAWPDYQKAIQERMENPYLNILLIGDTSAVIGSVTIGYPVSGRVASATLSMASGFEQDGKAAAAILQKALGTCLPPTYSCELIIPENSEAWAKVAEACGFEKKVNTYTRGAILQ